MYYAFIVNPIAGTGFALEAADILAGKGINAALVSFHTLKPFDEELALQYTAKCRKVFTV